MRSCLRNVKRIWLQMLSAQSSNRRPAPKKVRNHLRLETLEDRTTPSTLDLVGGVLTYTGAPGETNVATLLDQASTTRLIDSGATITLGAGATAAGFTQINPHTVTGPNGGVTSIGMDLGDMADTANIQAINHPTSVATGDGNDTVNVSSNAPTNTGNLAGIASDLTIDAGAGLNTLNVSDFSASSGNSNVSVTGTQILGMAGPGDASAINYAATGGSFGLVRLIGSNSPTLGESFTVDNPTGAFRLDANAGNDTANVQNISAAASINMGAGSDTINVSSDAPANLGNLEGIQGALSLDAGTGANVLHVSDFGETTLANDNIGITPNQITGIAGPTNNSPITYHASGGTFSDLTLDGSNTLSDTFNITGKTTANLNGNGGDDNFNLTTDAAAVGNINGGAGSDTLSYAGHTVPVSVALAASDATGFSSTSATGVSSFAGIDSLIGGGNLGDSLTGENAASTWRIDTEQTYNDGAHTLAFASFETLNGGSDADTFNLLKSDPSAPLTLNGNDGNDTFTATNWDNLQGDVTMNGGAGVNTLAVDDTAKSTPVFYTVESTDLQRENGGTLYYADMATISVDAGSGDGNAINVESTPTGASVTVTGGAGHNDFQVSQVANNLDALQGDLILAAGSPTDTLTVNDQLNPNDSSYAVSDTSLTRTGAAAITLIGNFDQLVASGGSGVNVFDVRPSLHSTITVDGGPSGSNHLTYETNGSTTSVDDGFSITDPTAGVQPVNYSGFSAVSRV
jgi:hypothetical protein